MVNVRGVCVKKENNHADVEKKSDSHVWKLIPIFGFISMFGLSMAIFDIPIGFKIAQFGALWFMVSVVLGGLWIAKEKDEKNEK